jgi:hypothetical protein
MQLSLIEPGHAYVSRYDRRRRYVRQVEDGQVAYRQFIFGIPIYRSQSLDAFAHWAHEDAELSEKRWLAAPV